MKRESSSPLGLYTIGIAALFLAGFFLLVVFGAQSYRNTVSGQNFNGESRALLSYLATTVKGYDSRGAVAIAQTEEGPTLVIADGNTGFALRIYCHEGQLMEDYAAAELPLSPEDAKAIGATERFALSWIDGTLLRMETDAGPVLVHLRSGEAAA